MGRPSRYPEEFRREAVQMALAADTSWASVARRLGVNETTLRNWVACASGRGGAGGGSAEGDAVGVRGVAAAAARGRRAEGGEGDPARGSRVFRAGDDPVCRFRFVAEYRHAYGVKRLCRVVGVSRSGFYAFGGTSAASKAPSDQASPRPSARSTPGPGAPTGHPGCTPS